MATYKIKKRTITPSPKKKPKIKKKVIRRKKIRSY